MGNQDQARLLLQEVKERANREYVGNAFIGLSEAWLGDMEAAFRYLDKAFWDRESVLLTFRKELWVPDFLRADPRFQKIMDQMAFPVMGPEQGLVVSI
jgi:adenylate cyclase